MRPFTIRAVVLAAMALVTSADGQQSLGSITGNVADPSGAVIQNAEVLLIVLNQATGLTLMSHTNSSGLYRSKSRLAPTR